MKADLPSPAYLPRRFRPATGLGGPHAQTIAGKLLRPDIRVPFRRERLELSDGDFLELDVAPEPARGAPAALILHGLEGSSSRRYVRIAARHLLEGGIRPIGVNFRGCGGEPNRLPRFYHSGETEDLATVVRHVHERLGGVRLGAVGFSLGGNVLLKYLGERGTESSIGAAAAVSVPYDLAAGSKCLERGLPARLYTGYFLRSLRRKLRVKGEVLEGHPGLRDALRARTLREFDDLATAPLHGFRDAADYYRRSSAEGFVSAIRTPTLLLHALDDPFLPGERLPMEAVAANPCLTAVFTEHGGHVGFLAGSPWRPRFWAEEEAARFLRHHLSTRSADSG